MIRQTDDYYSICRSSAGDYGVDEGLIFSFPSQTKQGNSQVVTGIEHNEFGEAKMQATLDELRQERDAVKAMGLIE